MENLKILQAKLPEGQVLSITKMDFTGFPIENEINILILDLIKLYYMNLSIANTIEISRIYSLRDVDSMENFYNKSGKNTNQDNMVKVLAHYSKNIKERINDLKIISEEYNKSTQNLSDDIKTSQNNTLKEKKSAITKLGYKKDMETLQAEVDKSKGFWGSIFGFFGYKSKEKYELSQTIQKLNGMVLTREQMETFIKNTDILKDFFQDTTGYIHEIRTNLDKMNNINKSFIMMDFEVKLIEGTLPDFFFKTRQILHEGCHTLLLQK
ncbi:hypothetical protein ACTA71_007263 [Dictyostelium dimigraforme]